MKRALYLFVMLIPVLLSAQTGTLGLDVVWQKEIPGLDVSQAKFSADGRYLYLAVGTEIRKMSVENGEVVSNFPDHVDYDINEMNISKNGNYLVVVTGAGSAHVFDLRTEKKVFKIPTDSNTLIDPVYTADISNNEELLYLGGYVNNDCYTVVYNFIEDKEVARVYVGGIFKKLKLSHDGKQFVTGTSYKNYMNEYYNRLVLWSTDSMKQVAVLEDVEANPDGFYYIKFSNNDKYLGYNRKNYTSLKRTMRILSINTNELIFQSDSLINCYQFEILPDNESFLLYYYSNIIGHKVELHDFSSKIKEYVMNAGIMDSYDSSGVWKVLCHGNSIFTLLTNSTNYVNDQNPDKNIIMSVENGNIIMEVNEIISSSVNVTIYDLLGNIIYSEIVENSASSGRYTLNVILPSGVYISKAQADGKEYSFRLNVVR